VPFAGGGPPATVQGQARAAATAAFVVVPFAGLGVAVWLAWGHGLNLADIPARLTARRRNPGRDQPQPAFQPGGRRAERAVIPGRRLPQLPVSSDRLA
jgi:hypothetical protein